MAGHHPSHSHHESGSTGNITRAFWLNTFFALLEIAGGIYTNSVAILSDALHDFGDSFSLGLAYYFQKKSKAGRDSTYSYGYKRFSLVGAFVNAIVLLIGSLFVIIEAAERLRAPEQPDARGMIVFALIGIGANLAAMLRLRRGKSISERVVALHFLEDVLGWVAVLIGAVVMLFVNIPVLDPILSIIIALYILWNVYRNLKSVFRIILQGVPLNISEEEIRARLSEIKDLSEIHDLHIWTLDGMYNILTLHAVVRSGTSIAAGEDIKKAIRSRLSHLNIQHATIEIETSQGKCDLDAC